MQYKYVKSSIHEKKIPRQSLFRENKSIIISHNTCHYYNIHISILVWKYKLM